MNAQATLQHTLEQHYQKYDLAQIDTKVLYDKLKDASRFHKIELELGGERYSLDLWDSGLRSEHYKVKLSDGKAYNGSVPLTLKGYVNGDLSSNVRLTVNKGFLSGFIRYKNQKLNIQPAHYYNTTTSKDLVVSYYDTDVIEEGNHTCGVHSAKNFIKVPKPDPSTKAENRSVGMCFEVEIALAADWSMVQEFGSASAVENQVSAVLNDVQGNYDDEFADEILYEHVETWISNCSSCDPWTSSTDIEDVLDDFTDWAPSNFGGHDVATLWSDRNFDGPPIGLAWVGAVCTNFSYNVCQDFTFSASQLRVLQAHELGHNWDARHDSGGGFIMSETVSSSTTWSSDSKDDIEDFLLSRGCLSDCTTGSAPSSDFDYDILEDCVVGQVAYFDESSGATSWNWTFEGGEPSTSNEQNPVVLYNFSGVFDVTLEVANPFGSDVS